MIDKIKLNEVILFAENDYHLYEILMNVYLENLKRKKIKGTYDKLKSYKLLEYYYSNYVRPEMKKPSKYGFDPKLNPEERKLFGKYFGDYLFDEFLINIKKRDTKKGIAKSKRKLKNK